MGTKPGPGPTWIEWRGGVGDALESVEIRRYENGRIFVGAVLEARRRAEAMIRLERLLENLPTLESGL